MKNILKLHEAIAVVLLKQPERSATLEEISKEITRRKLYFKKNGEPVSTKQIRLRTHPKTNSGKFYSHLFKFTEPNVVQLL